ARARLEFDLTRARAELELLE
ncbi:hypothetical protein CCACVL1_05136, partial [Corchorus capsularis]